MNLEQYRAWQNEHEDLKKRLVNLQLELQAAHDKLEVYRRMDRGGTDLMMGDEDGAYNLQMKTTGCTAREEGVCEPVPWPRDLLAQETHLTGTRMALNPKT